MKPHSLLPGHRVFVVLTTMAAAFLVTTGEALPQPTVEGEYGAVAVDTLRSSIRKVFVAGDNAAALDSLIAAGPLYRVSYRDRELFLFADSVETPTRTTDVDYYNTLYLRSLNFDTSDSLSIDSGVSAYFDAPRVPPGTGRQLHLVHFVGPIRPDWQEDLLQLGEVRIIGYVPENAYLIWADYPALCELAVEATYQPHIQWHGPYSADLKLDPRLDATSTDTMRVWTQLVSHAEIDSSLQVVRSVATAVLSDTIASGGIVGIVADVVEQDLPQILSRPDVVSVEPYLPAGALGERQVQILRDKVQAGQPQAPGTNQDHLEWLSDLGLNGEYDFVVDVADSGIDSGYVAAGAIHPTFLDMYGNTRIKYARRVDGDGISSNVPVARDLIGHGTMTASIVGGYPVCASADPQGFRYSLGVNPFVPLGISKILVPGDFCAEGQTACIDPALDFNELVRSAYQEGARIVNNSWASKTSMGYDFVSRTYDLLIRDAVSTTVGKPETLGNQEIVAVFASGNMENALGGKGSTAKNTIVTGASESFTSASTKTPSCGVVEYTLSNTADCVDDVWVKSGGTTDQQFWKAPDLVAPGTCIHGATSRDREYAPPDGSGMADYYPDNGSKLFSIATGTSFAAPAVSGAAALLRQWFVRKQWAAPSPAMTKAYLMNSATYLTGERSNLELDPLPPSLPSYTQGMGRLNLARTFDTTSRLLRDQVHILRGDAMANGAQAQRYWAKVADKNKNVRVTLAYTDSEALTLTGAETPSETNSKRLVNDLDLIVCTGSVLKKCEGGKRYWGNSFQTSQPVSNTTSKPDKYNNEESVYLASGLSGFVTVEVDPVHINLDAVCDADADPSCTPPPRQDFALVGYNLVQAHPIAIDLILALDVSSQMNFPPSPASPSGMSLTRDASELFIQLWKQFSVEDDRIGLVLFGEDVATVPSAAPLPKPLTTFADDVIDAIPSSGNSSDCSALGGAIVTAKNGFQSPQPTTSMRQVLLVSGSEQNRNPMVEEDGEAPAPLRIKADGASCGDTEIVSDPDLKLGDYPIEAIHTVGVDLPLPVHQELMTSIASQTDGEPFHTSFPDEELENEFVDALTTTLRQRKVYKVHETSGVLESDDVGDSLSLVLTGNVGKVVTAVTWRGDRREQAVRVTVGGGHVSKTHGDYYTIASYDAGGLPGTYGVTVALTPDLQVDLVDYRVHILVQGTGVSYAFSPITTGQGAGTPMPLSFSAFDDSTTITKLESARAKLRLPSIGLGTTLSTHTAPEGLVDTLQAANIHVSPAAIKAIALRQIGAIDDDMWTDTTLTLLDNGQPSNGDFKLGDGVFSARIPDPLTRRPGLYDIGLSFETSGTRTLSPVTVRRTVSRSINDFDFTQSELVVRGTGVVVADGLSYVHEVRIRPKDRFGNYLGPGYDLSTTIVRPGEKWPERPSTFGLTDSLDGTYGSDEIIVTQDEVDEDAFAVLRLGATSLTRVLLQRPIVRWYSVHSGAFWGSARGGLAEVDYEIPLSKSVSLELVASSQLFGLRSPPKVDSVAVGLTSYIRWYPVQTVKRRYRPFVHVGPSGFWRSSGDFAAGVTAGAGTQVLLEKPSWLRLELSAFYSATRTLDGGAGHHYYGLKAAIKILGVWWRNPRQVCGGP